MRTEEDDEFYIPWDEEQWKRDFSAASRAAFIGESKLIQSLPRDQQRNEYARNLAALLAISELYNVGKDILILRDLYYQAPSNPTERVQVVEGYLKDVSDRRRSEDLMPAGFLAVALGPEPTSPFIYIDGKTELGTQLARLLMSSSQQRVRIPVTVNVIKTMPHLTVRDDLILLPDANKSLI